MANKTWRERALFILDQSDGPRDFKYREMVALFDEIEAERKVSSNRVDELQKRGTKLIQQYRATRARLQAAKHVIVALTQQLPFGFAVMTEIALDSFAGDGTRPRDLRPVYEGEKNRILALAERNDILERALGAQGMGIFNEVREFIDDPRWHNPESFSLVNGAIQDWRHRFRSYVNV